MNRRNYLIGALPAIILILTLTASKASADIKMDFAANRGYTGNLLNDSSKIKDSFSSARLLLRAYPHSSTEISLNNDYTYYSKNYNLSSFIGGVGLRLIPTGQKSPLSMLFSLNFSTRVYRDNFLKFNNDIYDALFSTGYDWRRIQFRAGLSYNSVNYTNPAVPDSLKYNNLVASDKNTLKLFAGINFTLFNSFGIDFEGGYAYMDYYRFRDTIKSVRPSPFIPIDSFMTGDRLESYYYSPRISRQLGSKVGINLTYNFRRFTNKREKVVYGPGTGWISPWASVYDGRSITAALKTYYLPHFIISSGIGYWDKTFFRSIESAPALIRNAHKRHDFETSVYLSLQRPIPLKSGAIIEPFLQYDYTHNISTYELYKYSSSSVSAGITVRM